MHVKNRKDQPTRVSGQRWVTRGPNTTYAQHDGNLTLGSFNIGYRPNKIRLKNPIRRKGFYLCGSCRRSI